jgi:hypothetical protein
MATVTEVESWARKRVGLEAARRLCLEAGMSGEEARRKGKYAAVSWLLADQVGRGLLEDSYLVEKRALDGR